MIVASTGPLRMLYGVDIPIRRAERPRRTGPLTRVDIHSTYSTYNEQNLVKKNCMFFWSFRIWLGATYGTIISFYILRRGGVLYVETRRDILDPASFGASGPLRMAVSTP